MSALTKLPLVLFVALAGVLSVAPAAAQEPPSADPNREVIAGFHPGVVGRPPGVVAGSPEAFSFPPGLRQALQAASVEHVAQLIPGFEPEDRFVRADWGEVGELTDWSDTYVLRLARPDRRPELIESLRRRRSEWPTPRRTHGASLT